jgi:hypothetical protein
MLVDARAANNADLVECLERPLWLTIACMGARMLPRQKCLIMQTELLRRRGGRQSLRE